MVPKGECEQDVRQACPVGWYLDVANVCVAPIGRRSEAFSVFVSSCLAELADYSGPCTTKKRFEFDSLAEKKEWGISRPTVCTFASLHCLTRSLVQCAMALPQNIAT